MFEPPITEQEEEQTEPLPMIDSPGLEESGDYDAALEESDSVDPTPVEELQGRAEAILQMSESADDGIYDLIEAAKRETWDRPEVAGDVVETYANLLRQKFPEASNAIDLDEALLAAPLPLGSDPDATIEGWEQANLDYLEGPESETNPIARAYGIELEEGIKNLTSAVIQELNADDTNRSTFEVIQSNVLDKISTLGRNTMPGLIDKFGLAHDFLRAQRADSQDTLATAVTAGVGSVITLPLTPFNLVINAQEFGLQQYERSRRMGADPLTAAKAGALEGFSQAADVYLDKIFLGRKPKKSVGALRAILGGAVGEAGTEFGQDKLSDFAQVIGLTKEDYDDFFSEQAGTAALAGGIVGGTVRAAQRIPRPKPRDDSTGDFYEPPEGFSAEESTPPPVPPAQEAQAQAPAPIVNDSVPLVPREFEQYSQLEESPAQDTGQGSPWMPQELFPAYEKLNQDINTLKTRIQAVEEGDIYPSEVISTEERTYTQNSEASRLRAELSELQTRKSIFLEALREPIFPELTPPMNIAVVGEPVADSTNITTLAEGGTGDVQITELDQPALATDANEVVLQEPDGTFSRIVDGAKKQAKSDGVVVSPEVAQKVAKLQATEFEGEPVIVKADDLGRPFIDNPYVGPDLNPMPEGEVNPDPVMIPVSETGAGNLLLTSKRVNEYGAIEHSATVSKGKTSGVTTGPVKESKFADILRNNPRTTPLVRDILNLDSEDSLSTLTYTPTSNDETRSRIDEVFSQYDDNYMFFANEMFSRDWGNWTDDEMLAARVAAENIETTVRDLVETQPELAGKYADVASRLYEIYKVTSVSRGQRLQEIQAISGNTMVLALRSQLNDLALARAAEEGGVSLNELRAIEEQDAQSDALLAGMSERFKELEDMEAAAQARFDEHDTRIKELEQEIVALDTTQNPDLQAAQTKLAEAEKEESQAETQASELEKDADTLELAELRVQDWDNKIKVIKKMNTEPTRADIKGLKEKRKQIKQGTPTDPSLPPKTADQVQADKFAREEKLAAINQQILEAEANYAQEKARLEADKKQKLELAEGQRNIEREKAKRLNEKLCNS